MAQPLDDLKIVEHAWSLSFNGAHWTVRVKNESRCVCYRGIRFKTRYSKPSGALDHESVIAQARIVAIQPGETKEVQFNDGMRSYAEQASISIESARLCR